MNCREVREWSCVCSAFFFEAQHWGRRTLQAEPHDGLERCKSGTSFCGCFFPDNCSSLLYTHSSLSRCPLNWALSVAACCCVDINSTAFRFSLMTVQAQSFSKSRVSNSSTLAPSPSRLRQLSRPPDSTVFGYNGLRYHDAKCGIVCLRDA